MSQPPVFNPFTDKSLFRIKLVEVPIENQSTPQRLEFKDNKWLGDQYVNGISVMMSPLNNMGTTNAPQTMRLPSGRFTPSWLILANSYLTLRRGNNLKVENMPLFNLCPFMLNINQVQSGQWGQQSFAPREVPLFAPFQLDFDNSHIDITIATDTPFLEPYQPGFLDNMAFGLLFSYIPTDAMTEINKAVTTQLL